MRTGCFSQKRALLAFIALLAAQSSAQTRIHSAILVIDTSNNASYSPVHWLVGTPYLSIKASNVVESEQNKYIPEIRRRRARCPGSCEACCSRVSTWRTVTGVPSDDRVRGPSVQHYTAETQQSSEGMFRALTTNVSYFSFPSLNQSFQ